jgi:hypothetical protein
MKEKALKWLDENVWLGDKESETFKIASYNRESLALMIENLLTHLENENEKENGSVEVLERCE